MVHGARDQIPVSSAAAWADLMPAARLLTLPEVGHFPWAEAPDDFFGAVASFLAGSWPDGTEAP